MRMKSLLVLAILLSGAAAKADFGCDTEGNGSNTLTVQKNFEPTTASVSGRLRLNVNSAYIKDDEAKVGYGLVLDASQPFEIRNDLSDGGKVETYNCAYKSVTLKFANLAAYKIAAKMMQTGKNVVITGAINNGDYVSMLEIGNAGLEVQDIQFAK